MLSKSDLKIIHDFVDTFMEYVDFEAMTDDVYKRLKKEYESAECPVVTHLQKTNEIKTRYDLTLDARAMFKNLKEELDTNGYADTVSHYRGISLDNTAHKINLINKGLTDTKEYAECNAMLSVTEAYLMILKSPEDMFLLGEFE